MMKTATEKINKSALAIEDAQEDIRELIKAAFFNNEPKSATQEKLKKIIYAAVKEIKIPRLRYDTMRSLITFADRQKRLWVSMRIPAWVVLFLGAQAGKTADTVPAATHKEVLQALSPETTDLGVSYQEFYDKAWKERVKPTLQQIAEQKALDPNDYTGRNSLRNLAEMEVRYQDHQDNIADLKSRGLKLVQASAHADCSDRCAPWQGRIYSLDGTSGEINGKKYVPLETATNIPYTTKAGRTYMNGLLGFNCRHYLTEYKGHLLPVVPAKTQKKEYAITQKQRAMEREIRALRAEAQIYKGTNNKAYRQLRAEASKLYDKYKDYSAKHSRAYYPMRVQI